MSKTIKCKRCGRRLRNLNSPDAERWNFQSKDGRPVWYLCPDCQTPEQNAEAEIRAATLDYVPQPDGTIRAWPKEGGPA